MLKTMVKAVMACALLAASPALALMIEVPMQEMVNTSDVILRGQVLELQSYWVTEPHVIRTTVTLAVREAWKGHFASAQVVSFELQGGKVGEMGMQVEDQPDVRPGDDVVVFLKGNPSAHFIVNNDFQGKYTVLGDRVLSPKLETLELAGLKASVRRAMATGH